MTITINKPTLAEAKAAMVQAVAENNAKGLHLASASVKKSGDAVTITMRFEEVE